MDYKILQKIQEGKKKGTWGRDARPHVDKLKMFEDEVGKYYNLRHVILQDLDFITCLLVIGIKKITWRKELERTFDIHPSKITEFISFAKDNNLILYKPFVKVDELLFQTVINTNSSHFYKTRDTVKVYTLSPNGEYLIDKLTNDIIKLCNDREDLNCILEEIKDKTKAHITLMEKIQNKEKRLGFREIIFPDGTKIEKETMTQLKLEEDTKIALEEIKQEKLMHSKT